jgi:hypothetical protein
MLEFETDDAMRSLGSRTVTVACSSVKIQVFSEGGPERKTLWGSKGPDKRFVAAIGVRKVLTAPRIIFPDELSTVRTATAAAAGLTLFKRVALPVLWC